MHNENENKPWGGVRFSKKLTVNQTTWIITVFVLLISIMIGYSVMDNTLELSGTSKISTSTLVRIKSITLKNMTGGSPENPNIEGNIKGVIPTKFTGTGTAVYEGIVVNMGSTEAILSTINLLNESNNSSPTCITMNIDGLKVGDKLTPSQEQKFTITVTSTCTETSSKNNEFSVSYIPVNPNEGTTTIDEQLTEIRNQMTALQNENAELKKEISKASEYYEPKDLTNVYSPSELASKVSKGDFSGLHIGDYFKVELPSTSPFTDCTSYKNVNYIQIAGMDSYLGYGDTELTKHHLVFVFKNIIAVCPYNDTNTNTGGYQESKLKQNVDKLTSIISTDGSNENWYNYVLSYRRLEGEGEKSSSWGWYTEKLYLLQEVEVSGSMHWSSGYGNGADIHLPLFDLYGKKEVVKRYNTTEYGKGSRSSWWLESPSSWYATDFTRVHYYGYVSNYNATAGLGVVPAFLFG